MYIGRTTSMFRNVCEYIVCFGFFSVLMLYKLCDRPTSIPYHVTLHNLRNRHGDAQDESSFDSVCFNPHELDQKHCITLRQKETGTFGALLEKVNLDGKLDELGILIISRCFHVHTLILIDGSYWTSRVKNDYKKTVIKLAFCGEGIYKELSPVAEEDTDDVDTVINKVDVLQKGSDEKDLHGTGLVSESETAQPEDSGNESDSEVDENYFFVNGVRYKGIQKDNCETENQKFLDLTNVPIESDSEEEEASFSSEDKGVQQDLRLPASECHSRPAWGKKQKNPPQPDVASNISVDPSNTVASQPT